MIPKLQIPKVVASFIIDKTADFLVNRLSNKVDSLGNKSIVFSNECYERDLRWNLNSLKDQIQNLEDVVYQGKRLYELSMVELISKHTFAIPPTMHFIAMLI